MSYTQEQFDSLPDFAKTDFVKDGDTFVHAGFQKVKKTADALDSKYKEASERLTTIESTKAAEIEAAKAAALESARSKGDVTAIEKRYQDQMADLDKRSKEALQVLEDKLAARTEKEKSAAINSIVSDLSSLAKEAGREAFRRLIRPRIDYNAETGENIYLDDSGRATSLDLKGFRAEIAKDPTFKELIKADSSVTGGGNANGGGNSAATATRTSREKIAAGLSKL